MGNSKIPYCTRVWNPVEGCAPCSPGCDHCWARSMAYRYSQNSVFYINGENKYADIARWDGTLAEFPARWDEPLHWRKPQVVFVGSRSDVALWPVEALTKVDDVAYWNSRHQFLLLTKRPALLVQKAQAALWRENPNVWLGITVWDQASHVAAAPWLCVWQGVGLHTWLSVEPMLGPIDMHVGEDMGDDEDSGVGCVPCDAGGRRHQHLLHEDCGRGLIDWVVVGGESGKGARPFDAAWARSLRDQCASAGIDFWFKQWGDGDIRGGGGLRGPELHDGMAYLDGILHHAAPAPIARILEARR